MDALPQRITDYCNIHPFRAAVLDVRSADEISLAIKNSLADGGRKRLPGGPLIYPPPFRAVGSKYSLSDVFVTDRLSPNHGTIIPTDKLSLFLRFPYGMKNPERLLTSQIIKSFRAIHAKPSHAELLKILMNWSDILPDESKHQGKHYVYVEAGIKLKDLLAFLDAADLSVATMGAGGGQSLAGAISTATHGGDRNESVLGDFIKAFHLISPTGDQFWVTEGDDFAPPAGLSLPGGLSMPEGVAFEHLKDVDTFRALQTSVGRLGIIHAVVLEVFPVYRLIELNQPHRWAEVREMLEGGSVKTIFEAGLNLQKYQALFKALNTVENFAGASEAPEARVQAANTRSAWETAADRACDTDPGSLPLHHLNLVASLVDPDQCWITRRWKQDTLSADLASRDGSGLKKEPSSYDYLIKYLQKMGRDPKAILENENEALSKLIADVEIEKAEDKDWWAVTFGEVASYGPIRDFCASHLKNFLAGFVDEALRRLRTENASPDLEDIFKAVKEKLGNSYKWALAGLYTGWILPVPIVGQVVSTVVGGAAGFATDKIADYLVEEKVEAMIFEEFSQFKATVAWVVSLARPRLIQMLQTKYADESVAEFLVHLLCEVIDDLVKKNVTELPPLVLAELKVFYEKKQAEWLKLEGALAGKSPPEENAATFAKWKTDVEEYRELSRLLRDLQGFVAADQRPTLHRWIPQVLSNRLFGMEFGKAVRQGRATRILDTHNYDLDGWTSADSNEFFFDANGSAFLQFIDDVKTIAAKFENPPLLGYIGIRFMKESPALIAMQQWPLTVSVEIVTLRSRRKTLYPAFWERLWPYAEKYGALPHWGQITEMRHYNAIFYSRRNLSRDREAAYRRWRKVRDRLDPNELFSTLFTSDFGLEKKT